MRQIALVELEPIQKIAQATQGSQYEGKLWLVGGCVRDAILGKPAPDLDIVLESDAVALAEFLFQQGVGTHPPVTFERFGTAMLTVEGTQIEFVTARTESYQPHSRKPDVAAATLREDALRRDFTVNTLQVNLHSGELVDRLGSGLKDLQEQILRTPQTPIVTMKEDPLRILRAVRFRSQLGFRLAPDLEVAIKESAPELIYISQERIRDEWLKMMKLGARAADCMEDCRRLDILPVAFPELVPMIGVTQGHFHHLDVWDHSLLVLRNLDSSDPVLALAALLHDVGKPETRFVDEAGNVRFFGHESVGASITRRMLSRLRMPNEVIDRVCRLVKNHMRLSSSPTFSPAAGRRLIRDLEEDLFPLFALVEADASALKPGVRKLDLSPIIQMVSSLSAQATPESLRSPLTGKQVMDALSIESGPQVGKVLLWLTEKVLDGELEHTDEAKALELIRQQFGATESKQ